MTITMTVSHGKKLSPREMKYIAQDPQQFGAESGLRFRFSDSNVCACSHEFIFSLHLLPDPPQESGKIQKREAQLPKECSSSHA